MLKEQINKALEVLNNGGIILYPTDTVWGLGCDATNTEAVAKIIALKGRASDKSFIVLLHSVNQLSSYVKEIPEVAYDLIEYAENPLTVIFSGGKNLASNVINQDHSVGLRVVKHEFCEKLLQRFKKPITSTSANISGNPTPLTFDQIEDAIKDGVDYIVDWEQDTDTPKKPSTIVKLGPSGQFEFIRR